jgi:predicted ATPase
MLTKLTIRNFKKFDDIEIELGQPVVFIGPNNSGKTSALQALALWEIGYNKWSEKKGGDKEISPKQRTGITVNRRDLIALPVPVSNLLWKDRHTHTFNKKNEKTEPVFIDIIVEGANQKGAWTCGFEFYYANEESLYCKPVRLSGDKNPQRMIVPEIPDDVQLAFLPPMSGLADREFLKQPGEIEFLIGQGQTAQVLRNMCFNVFQNHPHQWEKILNHIEVLFGIRILSPEYSERSEITIKYKEPNGVTLDISASGRGVQQTLLLLVHLYANPNSLLLLDEPDAHLEILRQRQTFNLLTEIAREQHSQIIAASHSEVVLNEAAATGTVVAFLGKPHTLNDRSSQVIKSLTSIGWDQYYNAEQKGWVLYLEDATDHAMLKAFAEKLNHPAQGILQAPFVSYVSGNNTSKAKNHFYGLIEAKPDLVGIALFDRLEQPPDEDQKLKIVSWRKREIENYLCFREVFYKYAEETAVSEGPLFEEAEKLKRRRMMEQSIGELEQALETLGKGSPWTDDFKVSDEFIEPLFKKYSGKMNLPLTLRKRDFYLLVKYIPENLFDPEISEKLDRILEVAVKAKPV